MNRAFLSLSCALMVGIGGCAPGDGQTAPAEGRASEAIAAAAEPAAQTAADASLRAPDDAPVVHVYKTPTCGCCADWIDHIEQAGFRTEVQDVPTTAPIRQRLGVPQQLGSCHTALVGDYVVEGHVPASDMLRMLQEKPQIAGIAVPGMPMGSPGMDQGPWKEPYDVVAFQRDGTGYVFQQHR